LALQRLLMQGGAGTVGGRSSAYRVLLGQLLTEEPPAQAQHPTTARYVSATQSSKGGDHQLQPHLRRSQNPLAGNTARACGRNAACGNPTPPHLRPCRSRSRSRAPWEPACPCPCPAPAHPCCSCWGQSPRCHTAPGPPAASSTSTPLVVHSTCLLTTQPPPKPPPPKP
jgi:hypothetical protein